MTIPVFSRGALIALTLALTGLSLAGCSTNPVTGESEFSLVSPAQEISIGEQQYLPPRQSQGDDYEVDRELSEYVNTVLSWTWRTWWWISARSPAAERLYKPVY